MKRALVLILTLILAIGSIWAVDPRLSAMGRIGIAVSGADMQSYPNPAAVFFDDNSMTFSFHLDAEETLKSQKLPYLPSTTMEIIFVADMITMGISISCTSDNYRAESDKVDLFQKADLNINLCAGTGAFSAGIGITGGSTQQRLEVPMSSVWDFPIQAYFSPFDRVVNSEYIQVSAGLMAVTGNISFGVLMADILGKDGARTIFNMDTLLSHVGAGVYYSRSRYSSRGKMNNFIYSVGVDIDYLLSKDRLLNAGAEFQFKMVRDSSIFARAGYSAKLASLEDGTITAGAGASFRSVEFSLNADVPVQGKPRAKFILSLKF